MTSDAMSSKSFPNITILIVPIDLEDFDFDIEDVTALFIRVRNLHKIYL